MKTKRIIGLLLALIMVFGLCACGAEEVASAIQTGAEIASAIAEAQQEEDIPLETASVPDSEPERSEEPEAAPEEPSEPSEPQETPAAGPAIDEHGTYTSKDDVALYIHTYGHLPENFITKKEAEKLGWPGGSLEPYAPGKSIGGSRFGNYEGILPSADGRTYTECDIDTLGAKSRGAKRIVFSNDGLIYYTEDHYESFELLYGEE